MTQPSIMVPLEVSSGLNIRETPMTKREIKKQSKKLKVAKLQAMIISMLKC